MSKATLLQSKAADLPEPIAAEVLDFLEFLTSKKIQEAQRQLKNTQLLKGAFKGRLSSSVDFAARKPNEIQLKN